MDSLSIWLFIPSWKGVKEVNPKYKVQNSKQIQSTNIKIQNQTLEVQII